MTCCSHPHLYTVDLPKALSVNGTINLVVETVQTHATYPWPQQASQKDEQNFKYDTELFVLSPYKTSTQRTKIRSVYFSISVYSILIAIYSCGCVYRSPSPNILSYTTPEGVDSFATDSIATKSGATVTYGPFSNIPESISTEFIQANQKPLTVHYRYDFTVLEIKKLERMAEISHWGANLNIHNNIDLHNAGPKYVSPSLPSSRD